MVRYARSRGRSSRGRSQRDPIASPNALLTYRNAKRLEDRAYSPRAYKEASDAYFVAADAFEAEGVTDLALVMRRRARALERKVSPPTRFPVSPARTKKIYERQRAKGKPAAEAFRIAQERQQEPRIVGTLGDVNWPAYEGGPIYRSADGSYSLEYILIDESRTPPRYYVYRTDLDKEPLPDWINPRDVAQTVGGSPSLLRKAWNDRNPIARALARWEVANYYGWENLDSYPLVLTRREIQQRYRRRA